MTDLGVLWGQGDRLPDRIAPALEALARHGLSTPTENLINAIRVALMHRSFLYENQELLPKVTTTHLDALSALGSMFLLRTAAINAYERYGEVSNGLLNREANHIGMLIPGWVADTRWLRSTALLSKGLASDDLPRKAVTSLFHQLLAVLCLAGQHTVAEGLVADLYPQLPDDPNILDPKTSLQEMLSGKTLRYEYSRTGPDHAATFHAVVTDQSGRSGTGTGGNKTAAGQAAALAFIQAHCLDQLPAAPTPTSPRTPHPLTSPAGHAAEVARLQEFFALPHTARGLLSQALIHQSWAYENPKTIRETGQRDNQVLAYLGSVVTRYEYTRAITVSVLNGTGTLDDGVTTPRNETYAEALYQIKCDAGLLFGRGQAREAVSTALASNAFQAIFAAVLVATRYPPTLAEIWPDSWRSTWDLIAPGTARPEDAKPRLDKLTDHIHLTVEYRIDGYGPGHARFFRAVMDIDSAALGRLMTIAGPLERSKDHARESAAALVMAVIDALADDSPAPDVKTGLVQFLVAHLATVLAANPSLHHAWTSKRLLGLHLTCPSNRLLAWADTVDRLIDNDLGPCPIPDLAKAYATAILSSPPTQHATLSSTGSDNNGPVTQAVCTALRLAII